MNPPSVDQAIAEVGNARRSFFIDRDGKRVDTIEIDNFCEVIDRAIDIEYAKPKRQQRNA